MEWPGRGSGFCLAEGISLGKVSSVSFARCRVGVPAMKGTWVFN